jgi:hypothetical protein
MQKMYKILTVSIGAFVLMGIGIYLFLSCYPSFFFSNMRYAANTHLRAYVLTDEQILQAGNFYSKNESFFPQQLTYDALNSARNSFFVVLAKNTGDKQAWGKLRCIAGRRSAETQALALPPHMNESEIWIIPIGNSILGDGSEQPHVSVEWTRLYTK